MSLILANRATIMVYHTVLNISHHLSQHCIGGGQHIIKWRKGWSLSHSLVQ